MTNTDPCKVCGSAVRIRTQPTPTFADPDAVLEERVCTNPDCETNEPNRTFGTPKP